jgi:tetratricopeptide (TPR) repeat protein
VRLVLLLLLAVGCASEAPDPPARAADPPELALGRERMAAGEHAAALEVYERWLAANPDAPPAQRFEVHRQAASACSNLPRFEPCVEHLERALELQPADPWSWYEHGYALWKLGRYEEAIDSLERALELDPWHLKAAQHLANVCFELDRREEALAAGDRVLEILAVADPAYLETWHADPPAIERWTRQRRVTLLDALGRHAEAAEERARLAP